MRFAAFAVCLAGIAAADPPDSRDAHPWEKAYRAAADRAIAEGRLLYVKVAWDI
jgi:hypothetical protein